MLKILACILMAFDHAGYIFNIMPLRYISRPALSFFAYSIAIGYYFSRKHGTLNKYLFRLFILAIISQFAHCYAFPQVHTTLHLNILFTWIIAILVMAVLEPNRETHKVKWWQYIAALAIASLSEVFSCEYGLGGVVNVLMFRYFFNFKRKNYPATYLIGISIILYGGIIHNREMQYIIMSLPSLVAPLVIHLNEYLIKKRGKDIHVNKWVFYFFYPVHMVILKFIADII